MAERYLTKFLQISVPRSKALEVTKLAIEAGFRHIDSAHLYNNEEQVGLAIRSKIADGSVKREDIFYTSKLWSTFHRPELVQPALENSLKKAQLDYVDLYLIHTPMSLKPGEELSPTDENGKLIFDIVDLCTTWEAMEKCKDAGLAKSIGVSNFNRRQLEMILNKPGLKYKPVCNQVECHPYFNQSKLLDFCKSKDIVLVAYSYCLCTQLSNILVGSQLVFEFQLTSEDMKAIDGLDRNLRYFNVSFVNE
uniref:Aldo-keto reductase family 1 member C3 n=1 Tax=Cercocebus atys TaxID=9531 RepID=A0A2K5LA62_CERAT